MASSILFCEMFTFFPCFNQQNVQQKNSQIRKFESLLNGDIYALREKIIDIIGIERNNKPKYRRKI